MPVPTVVSVCGDAGGAMAMAPVLALMSREGGVTLKNYAYNQAPAILERQQVPYLTLATDWDVSRAAACLRSDHADVLLAATSVNEVELEKRFVAAARQIGCPSVGLLDFWSNYRERFADPNGELSVPDLIAVMDETAAVDLHEVGIPSGLIAITGQPAFDSLPGRRTAFSMTRRQQVRTNLGATRGDIVVVFASQPLDQIYGSPESPRYLGYDQNTVLELLEDSLEELAEDVPVMLVVRRHPRELAALLTHRAASRLRVVNDTIPDRCDCVMAADLVVGMNSVLLLEACYLGCPVVSLQPDLRGRDALPSNRWGVSEAAYTVPAARATMARLIRDSGARRELAARTGAIALDGHAADRVRDCVRHQLGNASMRAQTS